MSEAGGPLPRPDRRSMSLAAISIRNPVFAWMLMAGIILVGAVGLTRLGVGFMPDVDLPTITVSATLEGADPEIMESEVVDVLEDAVMSVSGVKEVTSSARQGQCNVTAEFVPEKDIDVAFQDVQARVSANMRLLPKDIDPPTINKTNPEDFPILWVALTGMRSQRDLSEYAKNVLRDRFLTVPDTGDVMMGGYQERNLRIWMDPLKLQARALTADDVIKAVQREHIEMPAGRMEGALRESNVKVEGEALDTEQWGKLRVAEADGSPVYLRDVAVVEDGFADVRRMSRVNGVPAQGLGIIKQRGANAVQVAEDCKKRIAELNKTLPHGMELLIRYDQTKFIKEAYQETQLTLILSVLLTAVVCWIFLGSISSTFNVILAIPVSVFGTFAVIYFFGFTLNLFTLLALSLSIGLVVDDAIMVLENIYRHAELGHDRVTASQLGAEQIQFAALCATLAIVAIFLPVIFMPGVIGKFFFQFGIVLSVSVMISLLEALTLAPMRTSQFLRVGSRGNIIERGVGWCFQQLAALYRRLLNFVLGWWPWRYGVLLTAFAIFFSSLLLVVKIPKEEVPAQDQGMFMVRIEGPIGSSLEYTNETMKKIEDLLLARPDIESGFCMIGGWGGEGNEAGIFVTMEARADRPKTAKGRPITQQECIEEVQKDLDIFPGTGVYVRDPSTTGFSGGGRGGGLPVAFSIRGPDWEKLGELSLEFRKRLVASGKITYAMSDYKVGMPEVQVVPNRDKTLAHNVDILALGETVRALVGGNKIAKFTREGRRYDVRVRLLRGERLRPEDIGELYVRNRDGEPVKISELVDIHTRPSMQTIYRVNRSRAVTIGAKPAFGVSQSEALSELQRIQDEILPPGYEVVLGGSARSATETSLALLFAFIGGVLAAYMVLASQFNSFLHPFTILLALPFSLTGGLLALYAGNQSLNLFSAVALILLAGIVKKNSILLVDFTNQMRAEGKDYNQALREACPVRLRPILMTSVATIAGAVPGALALGPGGEIRIPMCIAVIGGVTVSTLLTLFVVPCFYCVAEDWRGALARILDFLRGRRDAETLKRTLPAVGTVNVALGALGFCLPALCFACAHWPSLFSKSFAPSPELVSRLDLAASVGSFASALLLSAGIGLLLGRTWARWTTIAWTAYDFLVNVAAVAVGIVVASGAWVSEGPPSFSVWLWVVLALATAVALLRLLGFPILLWYFMTRTQVKDYLASYPNGETTPAPDATPAGQ
jgi:HAE1 family hydrophobic/amphiphilic exporter-1